MCTGDDDIRSFGSLTATGWSRRMIARGAADGSITKLRRGVYADAGACDARRTAAMHGGAIACVSAARHVGLWVLDTDDITHVWLGGHGRSFAHDRCACVEHWDDGPSTPFAIPSVPRILRQILYCRGIEEFFVTLESALRQGVISPAGLAWLRTNSNHTARDAIAFARRDADSGLESLVRWRLRDSGLRLRSQAHVVSVGIVDFLIGDRLIVEVDGRANHDDASHRHRDLMRDANATMWGFVTLRFDYAMIVHDWQTVEQAIFAAVDRGLHLVP